MGGTTETEKNSEKDSSKIDDNHKIYDGSGTSSMTHKFVATIIKKGKMLVIPLLLFIFLLLLLIWDLKTSAELSEIVHDDHADNWETMNTTVLQHWFSPLDLCMLNIDEPTTDLKTYRQKKCSKHMGGNGVVSYRLFCGIGSSLGKQCSPPLNTRSFFTSRLIGTLGDPYNNLLKTSLRRLATEKKAVMFVGDAISKQNQEALICELMRTDRITVTGSLHRTLNSTASEFNIRWKDESDLTLDVIFMHMAHLGNSHNIWTDRRKAMEENISDSSFLPHNVSESSFEEKNISDSSFLPHNSSNFSYDSASMNLESAEIHMKKLLLNYMGGALVIANIGVWYNSREKYRQELPSFLNWLNKIGQDSKNIVMFRETSAQHWNHTGTLEDSSVMYILIYSKTYYTCIYITDINSFYLLLILS